MAARTKNLEAMRQDVRDRLFYTMLAIAQDTGCSHQEILTEMELRLTDLVAGQLRQQQGGPAAPPFARTVNVTFESQ